MSLEWLLSMLESVAADPVLLVLTIVAVSLISEDATTIGTALLVSQGMVDAVTGLVAINLGIIIGDSGLYGLGALGARVRRLKRLVATRKVYRAKRWIGERLGAILLATRFMPGVRLPTYLACGFFGFNFPYFVTVLTVGAMLWTGLVFALILTAGRTILDMLGPWKWLGALVILALGILLPHLLRGRVARAFGVSAPDIEDEETDEGGGNDAEKTG